MKIRVAMMGWNRSHAAETADEVTAGVRMPWIELDGHRFSEVVSARFEASRDGISATLITLELIGPVELVYTDGQGEPLPGDPVVVPIPANLGTIDHRTVIDREEIA